MLKNPVFFSKNYQNPRIPVGRGYLYQWVNHSSNIDRGTYTSTPCNLQPSLWVLTTQGGGTINRGLG